MSDESQPSLDRILWLRKEVLKRASHGRDWDLGNPLRAELLAELSRLNTVEDLEHFDERQFIERLEHNKTALLDDQLTDFELALRSWIDKLRRSAESGNIKRSTVLRWRRLTSGVYEFARRPSVTVSDELYGGAFHLPTWKLVERTAYAPTMQSVFNSFTGAPSGGSNIQLQDFALRTVDVALVVDDSGSVSVKGDAITARLQDLRDLATSGTISSELIILFDRLYLRDPIDFNDGSRLECLPDYILDEIVPLGIFQAESSIAESRENVTVPPFQRNAFIREVVEPRIDPTKGEARNFNLQELVASDLERVQAVLALTTARSVNPLAWVFRRTNSLLRGAVSYSKLNSPSPQTSMPAAEINDPNAVLQLWNGIQAIERLQVSNLLFAARRLSSSTTRDSFEDRLLNVTIAADALFLTDGEEVDRADRPSLRAAKWLAADLQDTSEATIANILHQTYALRNRVVHGLSFTSEDISSGTRTASPGDLINAAFSIVALALRKAVDHVLHTGEYYSPWREVTREKVPGESALAQSRAWLKANLPSLEDKYAGSFIAIDADKVVDSDLAFGELSRRISASFGSRPILIIQVDPRDRTPSNISGDSR